MAIVLLNGNLTGVEYPAATWGELLEVLDQQRAATGDVVTGVHLSGSDVPAFRAPAALSQALASDTEVWVETGRVTDLLVQTLDEASAASQAIVDGAIALGGWFRQPDVSVANRALPEFAENLGTLIVLTSTVAQGAGVDLSVCGDGRQSATEMIASLIGHTDVLLSAQRSGNWTQVADVLESDIAGAVERWPLVLQAIRQATPAATEVA